ncbi:MAG: hypothetical protein ACHQ9S_14265 [Candidatus Binatia bacterium]
MTIVAADLGSIIFMKVGHHAGETFEAILERKRREYDAAGRIFWGYGGGTMHPLNRVQPFVRMRVQHGERVSLVMQEIISRHPPTEVFATHYSSDGTTWLPMPDGVRVRGSRYALVLDQLEEGDLDIDLSSYQVGAGPSTGRNGANYIHGHVDKGCLEHVTYQQAGPSHVIHARYAAALKEPYAVLLKSE